MPEKPTDDILAFDFGGESFEEEQDGERLRTQLQRVKAYMGDGRWHTIADIQAACGGTEAAISARLRDLRKAPFFLLVARERIAGGLYKYCVGERRSEYPD